MPLARFGLVAACALAALVAGPVPAAAPADPQSSKTAPATVQERHTLDSAVRELELRIESSERLYHRADLDLYLQAIADKLLGTGALPAPGLVRVRVIKDADANAFVLPNGAVYVTTALLCDLGSEAEVASVLGHEIAHHTNSHALRAMRDQNSQAQGSRVARTVLGVLVGIASASVTGTFVAVVPGETGMLPRQAAEVWALASISGYSSAFEREADYEGLRRLAAAGYDTAAAIAAFEHLAAAADPEDVSQAAHLASGPKIEERITSYRALLAAEFAQATGPDRFVGHDEYAAAVAGIGLEQVAVLVNSNKLKRAQALVEVEIARGDSALAAYLEGEIARRTVPRTPETEARALAAYGRATTLPQPPAAAYREQGIIYRRRGDGAAALVAFRAYLERAPTAADAPIVRLYVEALATPGPDAAPTRSDP